MKRVNLVLLGLLLALATIGFYRQLLDDRSFRSRDHFDAYLRVDQYRSEVREGHWPQTLPDAVGGGGHAFPRYYPPLSPWLALGAGLALGDVVQASHLAVLAGVVLSVGTVFWLLLHLTGSAAAATAGALVYAAFPYRFTQLYERGAFTESWAMAWYPLVFLGGIVALRLRRTPAWWPLAIAALVLSHTPMALWGLPLIAVLLLASSDSSDRRVLIRSGLEASAWAFGLVAFYTLPVVTGLASVRASDPVIMLATPTQVAAAGLAGIWPRSVALNLGLLAVAAGCLVAVFRRWHSANAVGRLTVAAVAALLVLAGMIAAPESVWSLVPEPFRYIQFPWRLLGLMALLGSLVVGLALARAPRWVPAGLSALFLVLGWSLGGVEMTLREYTGRQIVGLLETSYPNLGLTLKGDYLPRASDPEALALAIESTRDGVGRGPLRSWRKQDGIWRGTVESREAIVVPLPLVAYDFHRVVAASGTELETGSLKGQLYVRVPGGTMEVEVRRRMPAPLTAGLAVSGATFLLLILRGLVRRPEAVTPPGPI